MADWAALPRDLILSIVEKIKPIEDLVVFGAVCKSWNEVIKSNKSCLHRQIPWLLMPGEEDDRRQQIYSLSKLKMLPNTLYLPEMSYEECIPLNYGWVLALFRKGARMNLIHPISRRRIELPPLTTCNFSDQRQPLLYDITAAAMSANPSESSDFVVMIVHGLLESYVSYWKPRQWRWTRISDHGTGYEDLTYYQDQFYSIDYYGKVWSFTLNNNIPTRRLVAETDGRFQKYVVGSLDRLLVLGRELCSGFQKYEWSVRFRVYEVDLKNGSFERITSLGDSAIFLGRNTSISVDHASEYQNLRPNHIYFSDNAMGCYSLEDDDDVELRWLGVGCRPSSFWFIPSLQSTQVWKMTMM